LNELIAVTDTVSKSSDTATEPPDIPDKCQLQKDALRGAMHECKMAMKRLGECQDAWFRCQHGVSLQGIGSGTASEIYNAAIGVNSGLAMMSVGLESVSINSGVRVD
jgi:hypothetical protein